MRELKIRRPSRTGALSSCSLDSGSGVAAPERLFKPSRGRGSHRPRPLPLARLSSRFRRRPRLRPVPHGCCFAVWLTLHRRMIPFSRLPNMNKIRLLLLDDHVLFREGLSRLSRPRPDLDVVGQCSTSVGGPGLASRRMPSISSCSTSTSARKTASIHPQSARGRAPDADFHRSHRRYGRRR